MSQKLVSGEPRRIPHYPTSAVHAGDILVLVDNVLCFDNEIAANTLGAASAGNDVREFPKTTGALNIGDEAYWDDSNHWVSTSSSGTTPLNGFFVPKPGGTSATVAAASGDTTVCVVRR